MGRFGESKYNCPECGGDKQVVCRECGSVVECSHCKETGWDPEQVDVVAFAKADQSQCQRMMDMVEAGKTAACYEMYDGDERLGRAGVGCGDVLVKDFLIDDD